MAPIYLNPLPSSSSSPFPLTKDDHHDLDHDHDNFHLFMINSPATHDPRQTHFTDPGHDHDHHNKVKEPISNQDLEVQAQTNHHDHSINGEPARWVSSKVRLVHKMISSSSSSSSGDDHKPSISMMKIKQEDRTPQQQPSTTHSSNHFAKNKNSTVIRVCSDCSTTSTPLWRSGPRGPKSLCNACGIRQRKARRAMAEAQNGTVWSHEPSPVARAQNKSQIKEKKPRTGLAGTIKKQQCKPLPAITGPSISNNVNDNNNQFFKDLALRLRNSSTLQRVFPRDEEEAALLLMELSCGLVHT